MAEQREIVITIKNETGGSVREESQQVAQGQEINSDLTREVAGISIMANKMFDNAVQMTKNIAMYQIERKFALTDDYIGQRNFNVARATIGLAAGFIQSTASSAAIGATFGPAGAIIGAVIGAGIDIAQNVISAAQTIDQQNINIAQINNQLSYSRQRAGFSLTSGSIGENL